MQGINFLRPGCCTLQLNVSRNVILEAYEMLLAEGLAIARSGSGTYVAEGARPSRLCIRTAYRGVCVCSGICIFK